MRKTKGRLVASLAGLLVVALAAGGAAIFSRSSEDTVMVHAIFADAQSLVPGNVVKVRGIEVGKISAMSVRNRHADVEMTLDPSVWPLHQDASATIRPVSLLGEQYVDLNPGSANKSWMNDSDNAIPASRTRSAVGIDQVLNSLDHPTSAALAALVTTLGEGVGGQGDKVDGAIKALRPAMSNTRKLGSVLDEQDAVLGHLLDTVQPVAKSVASGSGDRLEALVDSSQRMLSDIRSQRVSLNSAVRQLPQTLQTARETLAHLGGVADAGTPALRDIRPVTNNLPAVTRELDGFANSAGPALASLPSVLDRVNSLLNQTAPAVRNLRPGAAALRGDARNAHPLVDSISGQISTTLDVLKFWALSTNEKDGVSNYFRGFIADSPQSLLQVPGTGLGPRDPAPARPAPGPGKLTPVNPGHPAEPVGPSQPDGPGGTGLSPQQEQSLVGQLLGGQ